MHDEKRQKTGGGVPGGCFLPYMGADIRAGDMYGDVEVSGDEDGYTVDKVELVNEPKMGWEAGDRPKVQVTLEAGAAYYFSSGFSRSDIILEGDEGSVSSIQKKSSTLWVTITLEALDEEDEEEADEDDSKTQDNWSKAQTGSGTVSASDDSDPSYGPGSSGTEDDWEEDAWEAGCPARNHGHTEVPGCTTGLADGTAMRKADTP